MAARDDRLTIVVIGPKNSGKTVFLSALANSPRVGAGDPVTVRAVKLHWEALAKGENPPATAATLTNMLFSFNGSSGQREYNVDLRLPDYDGHFAEILSEYESGAKEIGQLRELVREADGFVVLMPADERDAAVMEKLRVEIGSFIEVARAEFGAKITRPLVLAVNKWDFSPHFRSAGEDEAARNLIESIGIYRDIYKKLQSHFADIIILPLSAYGHAAVEGKPGPDGLAPYRVEDPIIVIIEKCFASLLREARDLEKDGSWTALAALLSRSRALWRRQPDGEFAALFRTALEHCAKSLAEGLSRAQNAQDYEDIWNASPQKDFWQDFTEGERAEIEEIRRKCLDAASRELTQRISKTRNRAEYENILQNSPQGKYFADFNDEQRAGILKIAERHKRSEKRRRGLKKARLALAALFLLGCGFCAWWYMDFSRVYAEAMNPSLGVGEQWHELASFITRYGSNPVVARLFSAKLDEASKTRASLVARVAEDIGTRYDEALKEHDACSRVSLAARLIDEANSPGLNAPRGLIDKIDLLHEQSSRVCQALTRIINAKTQADFDAAEKLLSQLPPSPEIAALRERLRLRRDELVHAERTSPEGMRIAAIREEFTRISRQGSLEEAENFIETHRNDASEEARGLADQLGEGMGARFHRSLLSFIRSMKTFGDDELGALRELAGRNYRYQLDAGQRKTFADEMQKLAENHDKSLIEALPEKIANQNELALAEEKLKAATGLPAALRLGDNLFRYRRPDNLEYALGARGQLIGAYRKMLGEGISASNLEVAADEDNALKLHGRKIGSAFTKNNELTITFPGDMPELSWRASPMTDHEDAAEKTYFLDMGPVVVRPVSGEARLKEENFGSPDLGCASPLTIDNADLFELQNTGALRKPLAGSCRGLTLIFHRQGG